MPYRSVAELPPAVKKLPKGAQDIYLAAFNAAFKTYDGNEQKAHATAWTAVERKYKKNAEGQWVSKESGRDYICPKCDSETKTTERSPACPECGVQMRVKEARRIKEAAMPELSDQDKRTMLQAALDSHYQVAETSPIPRNIAIEEVFEAEIIYNVDGQSYKVPYSMDEGKAMFGDPEKVVKRTVYDAVESLRSAYQGLIQEVGKRNALLDAKRIKEIVRLCQELLDGEPPDEEEVKKAVGKVNEAIAWVRTQEATKTEEGAAYPASAYAYVPEADKPGGWKLRMWEDLEQRTGVFRRYLIYLECFLGSPRWYLQLLAVP